MDLVKVVVNSISNPKEIFVKLFVHLFGKVIEDRLYIQIIYYLSFGRKIDLDKPRSFNEKMNWLKLYNRVPLYTILADKYEVKAFVAKIIGEEFVVENYGVYDTWEDIDFDKLPDQFVIKGTHDSGGAFVCRNKARFDCNRVKRRIEKNLKKNYYFPLREWPYMNIKPRIIIDKFLDDGTGSELRDYKFYCFNGIPKYIYNTIKGNNIYENFYDMDFNPININHGFPRHQPEFEKPKNFELMKKLASKLSFGLPFVRVDFFEVDNKVYFGEFTFYDWGGMRPFESYEQDLFLGDLLELPEIHNS